VSQLFASVCRRTFATRLRERLYHPHYHRASLVLLPLLAHAVVACSDTRTTTEPSDVAAHKAQSGLTLGPTRPQTLDEKFDEMVDRVPGFAGIYYDKDGTPIVRLVQPAMGPAHSAVLDAFVRARPRIFHSVSEHTLRFLQADYDFRQLKKWHDAAFAAVAAVPGLAYTDIDEVNNRLTVAVTNAATRDVIIDRVRLLGIPVGAVQVPIVQPFRFTSTSAGEYLFDAIRPAIGGTLVISDNRANCTLGFNTQKSRQASGGNGVYDFVRYFVTNAHCMNFPGVESGTSLYQGPEAAGQYFVGTESRQPPWGGTADYGACPAGAKCSMADAVLIAYSGSQGAMGGIAKTQSINSGNIQLDTFQPTFTVLDSTLENLNGSLVSKVGQSSGWTNGYISITCFNQPYITPGYYLLCQNSVSAQSAGGDSGAPLFQVDVSGYYARMAGLIWGGNGSSAAYSQYAHVSWELTREDRDFFCSGYWPCFLGLTVSGNWH
jgi:hypothetical protein